MLRRLLIVSAVVLALFVVFVFVGLRPYRIPSSAMEPTLNCAKGPANPGCLGDSEDRVLACRICLDFGQNPSRGDIVVFNTPGEAALKCGEGGTFVKRVIGLPGETVREDDHGFVLVRGSGSGPFVKLKEPSPRGPGSPTACTSGAPGKSRRASTSCWATTAPSRATRAPAAECHAAT